MSGGPLDMNPYVYGRNNPLSYVDPDGEIPFLLLAAAAFIGGATNVILNWDDIHNFGQGLLCFGIGAGAGIISGATMMIPIGVGGFLGGAILGSIGGGLSGAALGAGNAALFGWNIGKSAFKGAWQGAVIGAVMGGITEGARASYNGKNFWIGNRRNPLPPTQFHSELEPSTIIGYGENKILTPHELGEIGERQAIDDFKAAGGKVYGRHVAYRVDGVEGYGLADVVGEKDGMIHIKFWMKKIK